MSLNDHEIVADNLLSRDRRKMSDRIPAYGLFFDPPLGRAGMTEAQVRASRRPALIGKREMSRVGRAIEKGETRGFMRSSSTPRRSSSSGRPSSASAGTR